MKLHKRLRTYISKGELRDALSLLNKMSEKHVEYEKRATGLSSRYNRLSKDQKAGGMTNEEVRIEENKIVLAIFDLLEKIGLKDEISYVELENKNEKKFLETIDLEGLSKVILIGHTGRNLLQEFHRIFEEEDYFYKPEVRILLRHPYSETQRRFSQIYSSIENVIRKLRDEGFKVELDFFENIPVLRTIICEYSSGDRNSFISFYQYKPRKKSQAWNKGFIIEDTIKDENDLVSFAIDWYDSFSGEANIHSIIFDFDDTLVNSLDIQVRAWCETIKEMLEKHECNIEYIDSKVASVIENKEEFFDVIKRIFVKEQMADQIRKVIFCNTPRGEEKRITNKIKSIRFNKREELSRKHAKFFNGAKKTLSILKEQYQLAIISSTSESLIRYILRKNEMFSYFSDIFGKYGPKEAWKSFESKSERIIKYSKKTGVPLDRIIYIGDNNGDYRATNELGVKFIEARIQTNKDPVLIKLGVDTLVNYDKNSPEISFFTTYEDSNFFDFIKKYDLELYENKEKLNVDFLRK